MPTIRFVKPALKPIEVSDGANLMASLLAAGIPVASSCGGDAVCAKCGLRIVEGAAMLSVPEAAEIYLLEKNRFRPEIRISCQTRVYGDIVIDAGYW
jgi:2Fe-2S ferredoxin